MDRTESAWLKDQNTAPYDDLCARLIQQTPLSGLCLSALLKDRDTGFLQALLLRGFSRLWTAGPSVNPQPL